MYCRFLLKNIRIYGNGHACFSLEEREIMKKIVIVEDKPWVTQDAVCSLQQKNVNVERVVYYPNAYGDEDEKRRLLDEFKNRTSVEINKVQTQEEFVNKMEELYQMEDIIFFMDYELKGDSTEEADKRINIRYAKYKEYGNGIEPEKRRIWFYTSSSVANVAILNQNFPDRVLPVTKYYEGKLEWKEETVNEILR